MGDARLPHRRATLPGVTDDRPLRRVRAAILRWYDADHRDYPWRATRDPWAVLVSEVMLQQTQAARIAARFPAFLARFPTPAAMAEASDAEVLAAWSGLGYNRRALALRQTALAVERDGWPRDVAGLAALPGIGPYTSRAVAGLAFGSPVGVVDTNVRRWLVRRLGLAVDAAPHELQARADALAAPARDGAEAAAWIHASMEFGGRICRARDPRCGDCPVARGCPSRRTRPRVPVPRQAPFTGSMRADRGAVLRALASTTGHALPLATLPGIVAGDPGAVLEALARDGLAHRDGETVRLGPRAAPRALAEPAATIGP
jgi:A/G-specific adenine glycosylase